ncbi:pyrroloquinoline quinone biosynthesis protein PqqB [soil metagenome]
MHSCLAFSDLGRSWYLINATPDVRFQIERMSQLHPGPGIRQSPLEGILLTDAELDHTIGLLVLREGASLDIYATTAVESALDSFFPVRTILSKYANFAWHSINPLQEFELFGGRILVRPVCVSDKKPRYAEESQISQGWVLAYYLRDLITGGSLFFAPQLDSFTDPVKELLSESSCVLIDGTFWSQDELTALGISTKSAQAMGHLPILGSGGIAESLSGVQCQRKILIHINNTNPILDAGSEARAYLQEQNIEVVSDGLFLEI